MRPSSCQTPPGPAYSRPPRPGAATRKAPRIGSHGARGFPPQTPAYRRRKPARRISPGLRRGGIGADWSQPEDVQRIRHGQRSPCPGPRRCPPPVVPVRRERSPDRTDAGAHPPLPAAEPRCGGGRGSGAGGAAAGLGADPRRCDDRRSCALSDDCRAQPRPAAGAGVAAARRAGGGGGCGRGAAPDGAARGCGPACGPVAGRPADLCCIRRWTVPATTRSRRPRG